MAPKRVVNSEISGLSMATSAMNLVKVTPVVSHTSSNTGALVLVGAGADVDDSVVEKRVVVDLVNALEGANAAAVEAVKRIAIAVNFILESGCEMRRRKEL